MSTVAKLLRQNDFRLYYQIPSSNENIIPIHLPLCLAYMSAAGKIYHFPIACTKDEKTGRESWRVLYGDPRPSSFATLAALVKYHKIYSYMDPKTGAIDTFPVWKGAIIDSDEVD
uniref:SH2 domain-containing protein n=1 Tax=Setaria digitata TaxID=48799 RepID=A0A915PUL1_9BILA